MPAWSVPRMWEGQRGVVMASGPSMSLEVAEIVRRSSYRAIVVNNTYQLAPWADMLYAADAQWWQVKQADATLAFKPLAFEGWKVCCLKQQAHQNVVHGYDETPFPEVFGLKFGGRLGFDPDPGRVCSGSNSGYQAIHVGAHAGLRQILLCGFDMHGGHWHDRHASPLRDHSEGIYPAWIEAFETLAPELERQGIEVLNCTPGSALRCFPMADLKEVLGASRALHAA